MSWSFVCVDGAEGLEADSRESGAKRLSLGASCISGGVPLRRVEGARGSQFVVLRSQLAIVF